MGACQAQKAHPNQGKHAVGLFGHHGHHSPRAQHDQSDAQAAEVEHDNNHADELEGHSSMSSSVVFLTSNPNATGVTKVSNLLLFSKLLCVWCDTEHSRRMTGIQIQNMQDEPNHQIAAEHSHQDATPKTTNGIFVSSCTEMFAVQFRVLKFCTHEVVRAQATAHCACSCCSLCLGSDSPTRSTHRIDHTERRSQVQ